MLIHFVMIALFFSFRWWYVQECKPISTGQTEPADGKDDGSKSSSSYGYVLTLYSLKRGLPIMVEHLKYRSEEGGGRLCIIYQY